MLSSKNPFSQLKNQNGGVLAIAMIVCLVSVMSSFYILQRASDLMNFSQLPRMQSKMLAAELKVRGKVNEGVFFTCPNQTTCTIDSVAQTEITNFKISYPTGSNGYFYIDASTARIDTASAKFIASLAYKSPTKADGSDDTTYEQFIKFQNSYGIRKVEIPISQLAATEGVAQCTDGKLYYGVDENGNLVCRQPQPINCPTGQYVKSINSDLSVQCAPLNQSASCTDSAPVMNKFNWSAEIHSSNYSCAALTDPWKLENETPSFIYSQRAPVIRAIASNCNTPQPSSNITTTCEPIVNKNVDFCEIDYRTNNVNTTGWMHTERNYTFRIDESDTTLIIPLEYWNTYDDYTRGTIPASAKLYGPNGNLIYTATASGSAPSSASNTTIQITSSPTNSQEVSWKWNWIIPNLSSGNYRLEVKRNYQANTVSNSTEIEAAASTAMVDITCSNQQNISRSCRGSCETQVLCGTNVQGQGGTGYVKIKNCTGFATGRDSKATYTSALIEQYTQARLPNHCPAINANDVVVDIHLVGQYVCGPQCAIDVARSPLGGNKVVCQPRN